MATTSDPSTEQSSRELVPFRVRTADGRDVELEYSSPRAAEGHDESAVLETLPWFEPGKPLRNYMLHETDLYDEVEQVWGRRWGAEGIGTLREVLVSRPTENEVRPEVTVPGCTARPSSSCGISPSSAARSRVLCSACAG
jgi:hypothetical protein